jgi:hypothetical protein
MKFIKTAEAQPLGNYQKTNIDNQKEKADFRIVCFCSGIFTIYWKNGTSEFVNNKKLENLKLTNSWACDF